MSKPVVKVTPWRVTDRPSDACCHDFGIEDANGNMVADVCDFIDAPVIAAAPDLLEALKAARDALAVLGWSNSGGTDLRDRIDYAIEKSGALPV